MEKTIKTIYYLSLIILGFLFGISSFILILDMSIISEKPSIIPESGVNYIILMILFMFGLFLFFYNIDNMVKVSNKLKQ